MKKLSVILSAFFFVFAVNGIAQAEPILWEANGHYYETIAYPSGITWEDAKIYAENSVYLGMQGHLATVTSADENSFIVNNLGGPLAIHTFFLGGFQPAGSPEPGGNWQWITGETWSFTNWVPGEPNNEYSGGAIFDSQVPSSSEEVLHFFLSAGQWNDVPRMSGWGGLMVEYETSTPSPVPEPASMLLFGTGIAVFGFAKRKFIKAPNLAKTKASEGNAKNGVAFSIMAISQKFIF